MSQSKALWTLPLLGFGFDHSILIITSFFRAKTGFGKTQPEGTSDSRTVKYDLAGGSSEPV